MERPTMKENLEGYSLEEAHKLYTDCPELYRHIVRLDEYIDSLEDELNKLALGKPEPLAKNKQFEKVCDCKEGGEPFIHTDNISYCRWCGTDYKQT